MITDGRSITHELALQAAHRMVTAARTAPKGKGADDIECIIVDGKEKETLADQMLRLAEGQPNASFVRDAGNIRTAECVVLIGCKRMPLGLNCGHCGFAKCGEKPKNVPCVFNVTDLGIAVGSAASVAADSRVDTRIMFTAGLACMELKWLQECSPVYAMPISITAKSPFFDRNK